MYAVQSLLFGFKIMASGAHYSYIMDKCFVNYDKARGGNDFWSYCAFCLFWAACIYELLFYKPIGGHD